jgi:CRISPR-associated protein Cas6
MVVDLAFRVQGVKPIPADHGYALYAAISRVLESTVHSDNGIGIHPIAGRLVGDRQLLLMPWSTLSLRVEDGQIGELLKLAGKSLTLDGCQVIVGVPEVRPLVPATAIRSRLVVIKVAHTGADALTAEAFAKAARKQMDELGIGAEAVLTVGKRRTLGMKQKEIVGYEVLVEGLTAAESIMLQERGLGGKRHMGCGVFVPAGKGVTP